MRAAGALRSVGHMVSPIDLQKALKGTSYPASKDDLVAKAKDNDAGSDIVDALTKIKDGSYDTPASLNHAIKEAGQV